MTDKIINFKEAKDRRIIEEIERDERWENDRAYIIRSLTELIINGTPPAALVSANLNALISILQSGYNMSEHEAEADVKLAVRMFTGDFI